MGFLKHLFFWPVTGPTFLTRFSLEKVQGVVQDHLTDDGRVKEALMELQMRYELGEVTDEEYEAEEARLMLELREVRRWREEFGMGTRGGVVQVSDPDAGAPGEGEADDDEGEATAFTGGATLDVSLDWDDEEG